ncbi:hypothetical protein SAMN05216347_10561 [Streptococcus equinus]|uniref:Tetratricopeptide repeat protein n=1 Tax=Streptococcus equinus TaxID=1335 RepID=A0A1H0PYG5_STREI|nr:tetratricopeptide repeat protein [Streptococcus equinus]SDP10143.1 hypothetical protein SAMN05216347_10561 [Streptococcus equinus]
MNKCGVLVCRLANLSVKKIFRLYQLFRYLVGIIIGVIIFLYVRTTISTGYSSYTLVLTIILWFFVGVTIGNRRLFSNVLDYILLENVDFEKYNSYHAYASNKISGKNSFMMDFSSGIKEFLKGNFDEALPYFEKCNVNQLSFLDKKRVLRVKNFFEKLLFLHQGRKLEDFPKIKQEKQSMKNNEYTIFLFEVEKVLNGKTTNYFGEKNSPSHLILIMKLYYQALSFFNANDKSAAKEKFQQIANENPELFYVREAKKYLEELDNE